MADRLIRGISFKKDAAGMYEKISLPGSNKVSQYKASVTQMTG